MNAEKSKTILLVEDESLIAMDEQASLRQYGYGVSIARTGEEAIEAFDTPERYDMVLMDIDLGEGIDGTEAASEILKKKDLPIVFLSSHFESDIVRKTDSISSYGYVLKNSGMPVLDASIKMAFRLFESRGKEKAEEEARCKSEARYRFVIDNAPIGIFQRKLSGEYVFFNRREMEQLECDDEEDFLTHYGDITQRWADRERLKDYEKALLEDKSVSNFEVKTIMRDGRTKWFLLSSYYDETDEVVNGFTIDITERKIAGDGLAGQKEPYNSIAVVGDVSRRERDEIALRNSEEKNRAIIEQSRDGIVITDESGNITTWNGSFAAMTGVGEDEALGKPLWQMQWRLTPEHLRTPGRLEAMKKFVQDALAQRSRFLNVVEGEIETVGGEKKCLETSHFVVHIDGGRLFGAIFRDTTDRRRIEQDLILSEAKYRSYVENATDGVFAIEESGRFIEVNKAACDLTGYAKEELLRMSVSDFLVDEAEGDERSRVEEISGTGFVKSERRFRHRDGSARWWAVDAVRISDKVSLALAKDITERKTAENRIREYTDSLDKTMKTAKIIWWELDVASEKLLFDLRIVGMFGYSAERFENLRDFISLLHPDDVGLISNGRAALLGGASEKYEIECRVLGENGKYRWYYLVGSLVRESSSASSRIAGVIMDIDDRKTQENKIIALLEEKELILKEVHHRIKNNMTMMKSLVSLQQKYLTDAKSLEALKDIESRFQCMLVLYDKLYQDSSFRNISIKTYLPTLIEEIVGNFPNGDSVRIATDLEDFILSAKTSQTLGIIINELITNIMKYAFDDDGGVISITARRTDGKIRFSIHDDGIGMPETVDFNDSTGFGLMLINQLSRQIDASIRIERGNGTRVILEFEN